MIGLIACLLPTTHLHANVPEGGGQAGISNAISVCEAGPPFLMIDSLLGSPQPGGDWIDTFGNPHTPVFNPSIDPPGSYCYVVGSDTACLDVTIVAAPNAGTNGYVIVCSNNMPTSYFPYLGGSPDSTGYWIQCGANTYCYVVPGVAPCPNDTAMVTVVIIQAPNAGLNSTLVVCSSYTPFSLFNLLLGTPQAGGTWTAPGGAQQSGIFDPGTSSSGMYCYTVTGLPPCASDQACVIVNITQAPDAGLNNSITVCENAPPFNMFDSVPGTPEAGGMWSNPGNQFVSGTYDPGTQAPGAYEYTVQGTPPCAVASSYLVITELPLTDPDCLSTGIDPIVASCPSLSPEPNAGLLRLAGMGDGPASAHVYDELGRIQWQGTVVCIGGQAELQLPVHIRNGRYTLILYNADGTSVRLPFTVVR